MNETTINIIAIVFFVVLFVALWRKLPRTATIGLHWRQATSALGLEPVTAPFQSGVKGTWLGQTMGGTGQDPYDVVSGTYKGVPVFVYHFEVSLPKSGFSYTIVETQHKLEMPHFLVTAPGKIDILDVSGSEWLNMGKDFDNQVSVYIEKHFEQEAYEILTPDAMQWFVTNIRDLNFELLGKTQYTYLQNLTYSYDDIAGLLEKAITIGSYLEPKFREMAGDVKAMEEIVDVPK